MFWPLFLFVLGISLIILEFVLPGAIAGLAGATLLFISAGMGIAAYPDYAFSIVLGEFFGAAVGIGMGIVLLSRTSSLTGLSLDTNLTAEGGYTNMASNEALVGLQGTVLTALRPSGTIMVGEERLDAVSDGDFINEGEGVTVLEVHGNRVVVEKYEA
tara:strand:+ start:917 stop:1390 length:474 start_codon:yes stop_codon:yes gene_type:complete